MKKRIIAAAIVLVLTATLALSLTVSAASAGVKTLINDSFTGGLTSTKEANNKGDGSYGSQSDMVTVTGTDGGKYGVFFPTLTGTNPAHAFMATSWEKTYVGPDDDVRYFIYEIDLTTETQYTSGIYFEFITRIVSGSSTTLNAVKYLTVNETASGNQLISGSTTVAAGSERGVWQHISFVVDITRNNANGTGSKNSTVYVYVDGELINKQNAFRSKDITYIDSMRFSIETGKAVDVTDTMCVDNVRVTKLTDDYKGNLASVLADPSRNLAEADCVAYTENYVYPTTRAIARIGDKSYSRVSEIEAALKPGDMLTVLGDIKDTLHIPCEMTIINEGGYTVNYNKNGFTEYKTAATVSFIEAFDSLDVTFHLGDEIKTVTYTEPAIIVAPEYDATVTVGGIVCKAMGFSRTEGGEVITDLGIASPYNKEFWLVYESPVAYAAHADGTRSYAYTDAELGTAISTAADGDVINLLTDATICTGGTYKINAKSLTIDLGGNTVELADGVSGDIFTLGKGGKLTVRNGEFDIKNNGRIPSASGATSISRNRLITISSGSTDASFTAEGVTVRAAKMLALIQAGTCSFTDCLIDFTNDYENMIDLYPSTAATPTTLNMTRCEVYAFKTIVNTYKPSSVSVYDTRINFTDCIMDTDERIITLESLGTAVIDGGKYTCQYFFGKANANSASRAVFTEGTAFNFDEFTDSGTPAVDCGGGVIARQNGDMPYVVAAKYSDITWKVFTSKITERWANGETPVCPLDVPKDTRAVRYSFPTVTEANGSRTYTLSASANFTPKTRLVLGSDLSINIYIPEMDFTSVRIGKTTYAQRNCTTVLLDGVPHYKFNTGTIDPMFAASTIKFTVSAVGYSGNVSFSTEISLAEYAERLLCEAPDTETYKLALSILSYAEESAQDQLPATLEVYLAKYNTDSVKLAAPKADAPLPDGIRAAIGSTELVTDGGCAVRLGFNTSYTGQVTVTYMYGGKECTKTLNVVNGNADSAAYVDIVTDATALIDGITVTVGGASATVSIGMLDYDKPAVLDALYTYAKCAAAYLNRK